MLILTRRPGESVLIQDDITVTVTHIDGGQVKLGFSAPEHIKVLREEVAPSAKRQRRKSSLNRENRPKHKPPKLKPLQASQQESPRKTFTLHLPKPFRRK